MVWCDKCHHGIWLGRVGIPEGADVTPFDSERDDVPEIQLIPTAMYTPDGGEE